MVFTPEFLSVTDIAAEIVESQFEFASKKEITLINNVTEEVQILADHNMLRSVLRNLISNAIKFTPRKGEVVLSAIRKDGYLEVSVKDSGMGMTEKVRGELFKIDVNQSTKGTETRRVPDWD